jgi:hypothetical protein
MEGLTLDELISHVAARTASRHGLTRMRGTNP